MQANGESTAGWTLVLGGLLLLAVVGKLDLVAILIPLAAIVAYGMSRLVGSHSDLGRDLKYRLLRNGR